MKSLVIVESFTKTKTIKKYLDNTLVSFSSGHIFNLPKERLGINTSTWESEYIPINKKIINTIREKTKEADVIYLASDPDLEGEAIAHHLKLCIQDLLVGKMCYRVTFNEITKKAVLDAIQNPRDIDTHKVKAQETRRIVDRLIGYKISPILWSHFNKNFLSAGRVQIAGLILCINQRNKILQKEIRPYWTIEGHFTINGIAKEIGANMYEDNHIFKIDDSLIVKGLLEGMETNVKYAVEYETRVRKVSPPPPYTTTSMQQDAYNKCKYNAKMTMKLAQDLYENGLITYMRTDSTNISEDAKKLILQYIKTEYGDKFAKYRTYKTKVVNAQEAHEAIRITNPNKVNIDNSFEGYTARHGKLYEIIWKRSIACLMADAEYVDVLLTFTRNKIFKTTQSFMAAQGFTILYDSVLENFEDFLKILNDASLKSSATKYTSEGVVENVPSMYNEVQLIKELEKEGIGRPSTYATIIDKLLEKKYVELGQNPQQAYDIECFTKTKGVTSKTKTLNLGGKQKDLMIPTELGLDVAKYLYEVIPYLCDLKFTAKMEADLDDIMCQKATKEAVLNQLHSQISASIQAINIKPLHSVVNNVKETKKDTGIVKTRYGMCYYDKDSNKYTNIDSYLRWKKKTVDGLSETDLAFFRSLPKKITLDAIHYWIHLGKFGLYLKDDSGTNSKLDKKLWSNYV
jgi:DNA topoisomerase-1